MPACPSCGTDNPPEAKFCGECGARLLLAPPAREARKTVTILFSDVTGSTQLGERLDPESLRRVMSDYFERMRAVLERHGGTVEKFIGDAVMAVFGIPVLHEDDALRAARAAVEMRSALDGLNLDLEDRWGVRIASRTGVNTGEVVAGDPAAGQTLVTGDAVNTAARLEQAASPGEILIGEMTFELVRDAVEAEPVDPLALKGKAEAVGAFRLIDVRPLAAGHERRLDARMIGRDTQLRILRDAFEAAVADRTCHLFTVLGPAGMGKSRLVREFVDRVGTDARILAGRCLSYGEGITFWPVEEMAIQAAGIGEDEPADRARASLTATLGDDPEAATIATQFADVLGIGGTGPAEPSWAIRRFFESLARTTPLVAVFDDIHWAEPKLLDVIEHIADWSRDAPILLVCMARPELLEERPGWGGGKRNAVSVHLEPLSEPEADELIGNLLGHPALTPEIRERIRAAAQGNPLFVEEMLQMLLDEGIIVEKEGTWVATVDLSTVHVPPAVSALLAARLDRLSADERLALEAASVVGEVFEPEAVRALLPERVAEGAGVVLDALLRKDLVRPAPLDLGAGRALRFRHILLRDAAYEAIPKADRASLHEAFAEHLGGALGERASEFDEFIGYHLERSHRLRSELGHRPEDVEELGRRAFAHLRSAGDRAFQRGDMAAAANLLGRGSTLVDPDDPGRLRIAWELGIALQESGAIGPATDVLRDARDRARALGDEAAAGYAECALWVARVVADPAIDVDEWGEDADRLIELSERLGDPLGAALAWSQKSYVLWFRELMEESGAAAERAIEHARAAGSDYTVSEMRQHLLATVGLGPRPLDEGEALVKSTLDEARARGDRRLERGAVYGMGMQAAFRGRLDEARALTAQGRAISQEQGLTIEYWASAQGMSRIERLAGDLDEAARLLREASEQLDALGETAFLSTTAAMLAEAELDRGDRAAAERWLEVAERTAAAGDRSSQVAIELVRGRLLAMDGDPRAEEQLRRPISMVDESDSPMWRSEVRLSAARGLAAFRPDEAIRLAREAVALAEAKGVTAYADEGRTLLRQLDA